MTAIYPSTALKTQLREIKAVAEKEVVHITENGWGKYVFMSEELLNRAIEDAVEEALYEQRVREALKRSRRDYEEGRYYSTREAFEQAIAEKRGEAYGEA